MEITIKKSWITRIILIIIAILFTKYTDFRFDNIYFQLTLPIIILFVYLTLIVISDFKTFILKFNIEKNYASVIKCILNNVRKDIILMCFGLISLYVLNFFYKDLFNIITTMTYFYCTLYIVATCMHIIIVFNKLKQRVNDEEKEDTE